MGTVIPFPTQAETSGRQLSQVGFDRAELTRILDIYGRMVAAGRWRDYAIRLDRDAAVFAVFRRSTDRPEFRVEKRPALRNKQGMWSLNGEVGQVIKRSHELGPVLAVLERRLMKIVD